MPRGADHHIRPGRVQSSDGRCVDLAVVRGASSPRSGARVRRCRGGSRSAARWCGSASSCIQAGRSAARRCAGPGPPPGSPRPLRGWRAAIRLLTRASSARAGRPPPAPGVRLRKIHGGARKERDARPYPRARRRPSPGPAAAARRRKAPSPAVRPSPRRRPRPAPRAACPEPR